MARVIAALVQDGGADPGISGPDGRTPLHQVAAYAYTAEAAVAAVLALLEAGASVDAAVSDGCMPLHFVAQNSSGPAVAAPVPLLVAHGAEVDARCSERGYTPLHLAAGNRCPSVASTSALLAEPGAQVGCRDAHGRTPLHCAAVNPCHEAAADAARALLAAGADPRARDGSGLPPLAAALQRDDADACVTLLQVLAVATAGGAEGAGSAEAGPGSAPPDLAQLLNQLGAAMSQLLKAVPSSPVPSSRVSARSTPELRSEAAPGECVVCLHAPRSHAVVPCGHLALCDRCSRRLGAERRCTSAASLRSGSCRSSAPSLLA